MNKQEKIQDLEARLKELKGTPIYMCEDGMPNPVAFLGLGPIFIYRLGFKAWIKYKIKKIKRSIQASSS